MSEAKKYAALEDDWIRLKFHYEQQSYLMKFFKSPSDDLRKAVNDIYLTDCQLSQHVTHCTVEDREKCEKLLKKAERLFVKVLKTFPCLNKWGYSV